MPSFHRPGLLLVRLLPALLFAATDLDAQILVGLLGTPGNPFTNTPPAAEWATRDPFGASGSVNSPAELDAWAQTLDQVAITNPLPTTTGNGTARVARHNAA